MTAYYNEIDPYAAQWLRNLISAGHIAPGDVDERSIEDVSPGDLRGYTQCHFFAGIGVWSYALRRAGWSDDRPVWTGSCPCQPFSAAGKGGGFADERHLWPAFFHLIGECRPPVIVGEQVASKDGLGWLDLVQADLEGTGHAFGAVDTCAAGFGAPHIRQRLYWIGERLEHAESVRRIERRTEPSGRSVAGGCGAVGLADADVQRRRVGQSGSEDATDAAVTVEAGGLADAADIGRIGWRSGEAGDEPESVERSARLRAASAGPAATGPTNGHWRDADWLFCRDGKWRPVKPGTFPLVDGSAFRVDSGSAFEGKSRVGMLKGAGNAIVADAAQVFIEAYLDSLRLTEVSHPSREDVFG